MKERSDNISRLIFPRLRLNILPDENSFVRVLFFILIHPLFITSGFKMIIGHLISLFSPLYFPSFPSQQLAF